MPLSQSATASAWSVPQRFAMARSVGTEMPSVFVVVDAEARHALDVRGVGVAAEFGDDFVCGHRNHRLTQMCTEGSA